MSNPCSIRSLREVRPKTSSGHRRSERLPVIAPLLVCPSRRPRASADLEKTHQATRQTGRREEPGARFPFHSRNTARFPHEVTGRVCDPGSHLHLDCPVVPLTGQILAPVANAQNTGLSRLYAPVSGPCVSVPRPVLMLWEGRPPWQSRATRAGHCDFQLWLRGPCCLRLCRSKL